MLFAASPVSTIANNRFYTFFMDDIDTPEESTDPVLPRRCSSVVRDNGVDCRDTWRWVGKRLLAIVDTGDAANSIVLGMGGSLRCPGHAPVASRL
jgi:hypothetical protein